MFALVDCNSFFASCEAIFNPAVRDKPIVVLSNNDGCIVARNAPAKALNIPDLVPYFKVKHLLEKNKVNVFSSNYELYGNISKRVMNILKTLAGDVEVYSIDEAFLNLLSTTTDYNALGTHIKHTIHQQVGMPVCIGIAPTKTLAKLANRAAKKIPKLKGVCILDTPEKWEWMLKRTATKDIWGVGRQISQKLAALGIHSAYELANTDPVHMKQQFSVVLERTIRELNGEPSIPLELTPVPKKQIICSRSFSEKILDSDSLQQAISQYSARACHKLRKQNGLTELIWVFVESSRFSKTYYSNSKLIKLNGYTNDTRLIAKAAKKAITELFRSDTPFHKCGIGLLKLKDKHNEQLHLFTPPQTEKSRVLMRTLDDINTKYGKSTLTLANEGINPSWLMARKLKSPAYTTRWPDIPVVKC